MDLYRSKSSNNSNSSRKSQNRSNGSKSYNLEYCTSSSSSSPFSSVPSSSSSARGSSVVNVVIDEVILLSAKSTSSSSQNGSKRKRRSSSSLDDQDPEFGLQPPLAKRHHSLLTCYQSDSGSVVSSVYPSPVDELVNEIDTHSTSECLSAEYEVADIPDSPNSIEDAIIPGALSPSASSTSSVILSSSPSSTQSMHQQHHLRQRQNQHHNELHHGERTPHVQDKQLQPPTSPSVRSFDDYVSHYCMTPTDNEPRICPLPALSWANASDVWNLMCKKDEHAACFRDAGMLENHPGLQPRMRAILLDWLIEVCEVYKLHRETYYLAVDYLDRYLSTQKKVQKTHLQLIGITCLFIAAKVEEIYPPKIGEFAYVTDGACQEEDILQHEILLLQALDWSISPVTAVGWLGVYMQLNVNNRTPASLTGAAPIRCNNNNISQSSISSSVNSNHCHISRNDKFKSNSRNRNQIEIINKSTSCSGQPAHNHNDGFIYPQFSGMEFVQTAQLLDLCSLDVGMGNYPYSVIAAAAISHTFNRETALRVSSLDWNSIQPCARWMEPFFQVISEESDHLLLLEQNEQMASKYGLAHICPNIVTDDSHIIQTHTTSMTMFDRVCLYQEQYLSMASKIKQEASPATGLVCPEGLLTPPASSRKPFEEDDEDENNETVGNDVIEKTL